MNHPILAEIARLCDEAQDPIVPCTDEEWRALVTDLDCRITNIQQLAKQLDAQLADPLPGEDR